MICKCWFLDSERVFFCFEISLGADASCFRGVVGTFGPWNAINVTARCFSSHSHTFWPILCFSRDIVEDLSIMRAYSTCIHERARIQFPAVGELLELKDSVAYTKHISPSQPVNFHLIDYFAAQKY